MSSAQRRCRAAAKKVVHLFVEALGIEHLILLDPPDLIDRVGIDRRLTRVHDCRRDQDDGFGVGMNLLAVGEQAPDSGGYSISKTSLAAARWLITWPRYSIGSNRQSSTALIAARSNTSDGSEFTISMFAVSPVDVTVK